MPSVTARSDGHGGVTDNRARRDLGLSPAERNQRCVDTGRRETHSAAEQEGML